MNIEHLQKIYLNISVHPFAVSKSNENKIIRE